jgi:hypothetical protein
LAIDVKELTLVSEQPPLDLSWLDLDNTWGVRAKPGRRGLTLDEIEIGPCAAGDDETRNQGLKPRGAAVRKDVPKVGRPYTSKAEVWSLTRRSYTRKLYSGSGHRPPMFRET